MSPWPRAAPPSYPDDPLLSRVDYYDLEATDELATVVRLRTGWFPAYESAAPFRH